jgi:membrane protein implicated in regulation of membrane protease activity
MVVVLFLLVLLAIAGVLGVVLKAVVVMVATAALFAIVSAWFVWWAIRRQLVKTQQALERTGTQIRIGRVVRSRDGGAPPPIDDRY